MVMGDLLREVDVAVVGGGSAGDSAALYCAKPEPYQFAARLRRDASLRKGKRI